MWIIFLIALGSNNQLALHHPNQDVYYTEAQCQAAAKDYIIRHLGATHSYGFRAECRFVPIVNRTLNYPN